MLRTLCFTSCLLLTAAAAAESAPSLALVQKEVARWPLRAPTYVRWLLPFTQWDAEYRAYFQRHYHDPRLTMKPTLICMHYTVTDSAQAVWESFARGCWMSAGKAPHVVWGHASSHVLIDQNGTVFQLMPFERRCTGAYGVNHKAISIEMVATDQADLLSRPRQVWASFQVVRNLMKRYRIPLRGIIAHSEVSDGRSVVPDYLDYADPDYPASYPKKYRRWDPGFAYMQWLRGYLARHPVAPGRASQPQ